MQTHTLQTGCYIAQGNFDIPRQKFHQKYFWPQGKWLFVFLSPKWPRSLLWAKCSWRLPRHRRCCLCHRLTAIHLGQLVKFYLLSEKLSLTFLLVVFVTFFTFLTPATADMMTKSKMRNDRQDASPGRQLKEVSTFAVEAGGKNWGPIWPPTASPREAQSAPTYEPVSPRGVYYSQEIPALIPFIIFLTTGLAKTTFWGSIWCTWLKCGFGQVVHDV